MNYNDLEFQVLSCIIQKPEFMNNNKLKDEYFVNHKRLWVFMKSFYEKFGNFDFALMYSIVDKKEIFLEYMLRLTDFELLPHRFEQYQQRLIDKYNEGKKTEWAINMIYEYANKLYVRTITIDEFRLRVDEIIEKANLLKKEEK